MGKILSKSATESCNQFLMQLVANLRSVPQSDFSEPVHHEECGGVEVGHEEGEDDVYSKESVDNHVSCKKSTFWILYEAKLKG